MNELVCDFRELPSGLWRCERCGFESRGKANKRCGKLQRFRGLGDVVAAITSAIGIEPCEGCKERQEKLNRVLPL